jgi:hypothetical protein
MYRCPSPLSRLLVILFLLFSATPLWAATYIVDRTDDVSPTDPTIQPPITDCDAAVPNDCTLRGAILKANTAAGADIIQVPAAIYTVVGGGLDEVGLVGDLDVLGDVTITGAGADVTIIDGGGTDRILDICPLDSPNRCPVPPVVAIAGVTLQNTGSGSTAGGIRNRLGTLTVTNSTFRNCRAIAVDNDRGTLTLSNVLIEDASNNGIRNDGTLTIVGSTIRNLGAGLFNSKQGPSVGLAIVRDSTFTGNGFTNFAGGAGIDNRNGGTLILINTTLSGNRGGGLYNEATAHLSNVTITNSVSTAGGIRNTATGTVTLRNSIVAGNRTSGGTPVDCQGILTSQGYNLIEIPASSCTISGDTTGNLIGVAANLAPLADNGGPTLTHVPFAGSPVLDAGNPAGCTVDDDNNPTTPDVLLTTDQRGFVRPFDGNNDNNARCDIGAVEGFAELFDGDGDGFSITQGDCNDNNPAINPSAQERCNTIDDNCNGAVDEGFSLGGTCTAGIGLCQQTGVFVCTTDGQGTQCSVAGGTGSPEICNGLDDDCDGEVDATALQPLTQVCYSGPAGTAGVGICQAGEQICLNGAFGNCQDEILPVSEVCDGLDNDCNGTIDDNLTDPTFGQACTTGQLGVCSTGTIVCTAGSLSCTPTIQPTTEVCDGLDNNCNGAIDEGLTVDSDGDGFTAPGSCSGTKNDCNDSNSTVYPGAPEICGDGLDNDCDGIVDLTIPEARIRSVERDRFGESVAVEGEWALVGATRGDSIGQNTGAVYVFRRMSETWLLHSPTLTASDGTADDRFGSSVALDGDTALIGADGDDDRGDGAGAVYVFVRTGTTWTQQAKLVASDGAAADSFGSSVALDGDTALIGAFRDDDRGDGAGAVYVFVRTGTTWTQQAKLVASDGVPLQGFGRSVTLDGATALIGAQSSAETPVNPRPGAAYVFVRTGAVWTEQAKLTASAETMGQQVGSNQFGSAVALEGDTALIGARRDDEKGDGAGAVYVFARTGVTWTEQMKLTASDGAALAQFGWDLALDGNTVLVGAVRDSEKGERAGAVYVFLRVGEVWSEQVKLTASNGAALDEFGVVVGLSGDTAFIGTREAETAYTYQIPRELCDGQDNNCNGIADEGFNVGGACTVGIGACQNTGALICTADGSGAQCTATPGTPSLEICSDGIDQDCNGQDLLCPDNTLPGSAVVVRPVDTTTTTTPVTITFSQVTRSGTTSLTTSSTGPPPPSGFALGKPPVYYDLTTTAIFSGLVEVCINYSGVRFKNEKTLKLQHFEDGHWVDRTISLDTVNDIICASVTSLSPFAIFEPLSVSFATFAVKLEIKEDAFEMKASFTLDATSDGINPLIEEVRLAVGTFATTIPAGSFKFKPAKPDKKGKPGKPAEFVFEGIVNGVQLEIKIAVLANNRFECKAEGKGTDLTRVTNPVTVTLVIGDDSGTTTVTADRDEGPRK